MPSKEKEKEMSLENHPNFHAVRFAVESIKAFKSSLRGNGLRISPEVVSRVGDMLADFAGQVEAEVDCEVFKEEPPMFDEVTMLAEKLGEVKIEYYGPESHVIVRLTQHLTPESVEALARVALEKRDSGIAELIRAANVVVDRFSNDSLRLRVGDILVLEAALLSLKSKEELPCPTK